MVKDLPKAIIADRFNPTELKGTGGFAEVWKAKDRQTGNSVALKLPIEEGDGITKETIVDGFEREIEVLDCLKGGITPSSIVRYVDGGVKDTQYLAFEYIEGTELDDHLQRTDQQPGSESLRTFGLPVVRAIEFLHHNAIAYLDLKPENILVRSNSEQPVLIDFNAAVTREETADLFGADDFKAPEQVQGTVYSYETPQQADIYSAGKLIYYLLSGKTNTGKISPPKAIRDIAESAGFPTETVSILEQALAPNPGERLADIGALVDALWELFHTSTGTVRSGMFLDPNTSVKCPTRPSDCVGRVHADEHAPDISVPDPDQYISPRHFIMDHDSKSWILHDSSLNGTYVCNESEWHFLLSKDGYDRLSEQAPDSVPDSPPPEAIRIHSKVRIRPVDDEYTRTILFNPS